MSTIPPAGPADREPSPAAGAALAPGNRNACLALLLLPVLVYLGPLIRGETLFLRDINFHLQPLTAFWQASLSRGEFPIWNPLLGTGMPLSATMELPFYYPPLIAFYYLTYDRALYVFLGIHEALLGLSVYALCRYWGWRRPGALISSLSFVLGGAVVSLHNLYTYAPSVAMMPLVLCLFLRAWKRANLRPGLLLAGVFALQTITSRPDISLMTGMLLAILSVYLAFHQQTPGETLRRAAICWLPLLAGVFTLALPALWPTLEMIPLSNRSAGVTLAESAGVALSPLQAPTLLLPHLFQQTLDYAPQQAELTLAVKYRPYLLTIYLGILPMLLGGIGALQRRPPARLLLGITAGSLLLALGHWTPVYGWFYRFVPLVAYTRFPVKYFLIASLCWCLLAGLGWQRLWEWEDTPDRLAAWALTLLPVYAGAAYGLAHPERLRAWLGVLYPLWVGNDRAHRAGTWLFPEVPAVVTQDLYGLVLYWTGALAVIVFVLRRPLAPRPALALAAGLLVFDLLANNQTFDDRLNRRVFSDRPPLARYLVDQPPGTHLYYPLGMQTYPVALLQHRTSSEQHSYVVENLIERRLLLFNIPLAYGLGHADAYGNMTLSNPAVLVQELKQRPGGLDGRREMAVIGMYGIATVIVPLGGARGSLASEAAYWGRRYGLNLQQILAEDMVAIYKIPAARARAYFVPDARVTASTADALAALGDPHQDIRHTVLLQDDPALQDALKLRAGAAKRAAIVGEEGCAQDSATTTEVVVTCRQAQSGFLVTNDVRYPGWQAELDGQPWPLLSANLVGRAAYLPAGLHTVRFRYLPGWFPWCWLAAAAGLVLAAVLARLGR